MRKLLAILVLLPLAVYATDLPVTVTHTISATDNNSNIRDTVYTPVLNTNRREFANYVYWWRTIIVGMHNPVDTVFGGDTLYIQTEYSPTGISDWTQFDSTKIVLNGNADTTLQLSTRINYDSASYCGNYWRVKLVNGFTLGDGDTAGIIGNVYDYSVNVFFEGKP